MKTILFMMSIVIMLMASCVAPQKTTQKTPQFTNQPDFEEESFDSSKLIFFTADLIIKHEWNREFLTMSNKTYHLADSLVLRFIDENKDTVSITFPKYAAAKCVDIDTAGKMILTFKGGNVNDKYLVFGTEDPDKISVFHLLVLKKEKFNSVIYDEKKFRVIYGVKTAKLMIDPEKFRAKHTRIVVKKT